MQDRADRDDGIDGGNGAGSADHSALSGDGGVPAGGGEPDFSLPADERTGPEGKGEVSDASRIDGLPDGWLDSEAVMGRGGSGPLDVLEHADDSPRGSGEIEESGGSHASRVLIGTGQSGIVASSDVLGESASPRTDSGGPNGTASPADESLAGSLGPEEPAPSSRETAGDAIDEWGDIVAASGDDGPSESVGFGALLAQDPGDQAAASDSYTDDSQGIVRGSEEPIEVTVPAFAASRPSPSRGGGIGQIVGVVLGGLLAIPVTLAILLWGFHRDPLGVAKGVPEGMRFLLPKSVRRTVEPRPTPVASSSLDEIASSAAESLRTPAAAGMGDPPPGTVVVPPPADSPAVESGAFVASESGEPVAVPSQGMDRPGAEEASITIDAPAVPELGPDSTPSPLVTPAPDFGPLDGAVERALVATENLGRLDPAGAPQVREQGLVAWYRSLAEAADLLAVAENEAFERGGDPAEALRRYDALAMRLASERVADIADLGEMWLAAARRPSEGAVLVGTLEDSRAAGPWRCGRLSVRGSGPRTMVFFTRALEGVDSGDDVIVTGVLGDASAMWASDVRRLAAPASRAEPGPVDAVPVETPPITTDPSAEPAEPDATTIPSSEPPADAGGGTPASDVPPPDATGPGAAAGVGVDGR